MGLLKSIYEFLATGIITILAYGIYSVGIFVLTIIAGLPVAIAIKVIIDVTNLLFTGVR